MTEGIEALYRAHAGPLRRYVQRLVGAWGLSEALVDAEGVVNETFILMMRTIGQSDIEIRNPTAWLFVVARRQVSKAVEQQSTIADGDPGAYMQAGASIGWTSLAPRPTARDRRGTRSALDAIAELPDRQKVAVYLRQVEGWTLEEIGEYLDCAASTAGVHVHRGTKRVRQLLEPEFDWDDHELQPCMPTPSYWDLIRHFAAVLSYIEPEVFAVTRRRLWLGGIAVGSVALLLVVGIIGVGAYWTAHLLGVPLWVAGGLVVIAFGVAYGIAAGGRALKNTLGNRRTHDRQRRAPGSSSEDGR